MRGTSAASLAAVRAGVEPVLRDAGEQAAVLGAQLDAVVDALLASGSLRRAVADPSRSADDKAALVRSLLSGKLDARVVAVVEEVVRARWSAEDDVVMALEELAAHAVLASAEATGDLAAVEDELFRVSRMLVGQREVRRSLVDRTASPEARAGLARALLAGRAQPATVQLVERAAFEPHRRTMAAALAWLGGLAADRRSLLVATVITAGRLTPAQTERLRRTLERSYGRPVRLAVAHDPEVIGGLRVQVGSQVVDATVLGRLDEVRRRLAG